MRKTICLFIFAWVFPACSATDGATSSSGGKEAFTLRATVEADESDGPEQGENTGNRPISETELNAERTPSEEGGGEDVSDETVAEEDPVSDAAIGEDAVSDAVPGEDAVSDAVVVEDALGDAAFEEDSASDVFSEPDTVNDVFSVQDAWEEADGDETGSEQPGKACSDPTGVRPAAIAEMVGTYLDGYLYFFGGDNGFPIECTSNPNPQGELWRFDVECAQWEKIHGNGEGPGPRTRATAILDSNKNRMLVFGGRYREGKEGDYTIFNDVWALNLETHVWTQLETTGDIPSARWSATGIHDPIRNRFIIFSGNTGTSGLSYEPAGDAFALNLETNVWEKIGEDSPSMPPHRLFATSTYDDGRDAMIVFGGTTAFFGPQLNDVWALNLNTDTWELYNMGMDKAPEPRFWSSINVDDEGDRYVVFGGHDDGALGNRNDIWVYTPGADVWDRASGGDLLNPAAPPPAWCDYPVNFVLMEEDSPERRHMHLTLLGDNRDLYVIGGKTDCGIVDDVWRLNMSDLSWELLFEPTVGVTCERSGTEDCESLCQ